MTQKQMPSQREQYGGTVHLFIGAGHSPYKITPMPFTFGSNSIVILQGLNSLFIFKSVPFSAITPKLSCSHLRRCVNLRILWAFPTVVLIRVRRYLFTHYTPETSLNHVFEDLRKPKAPNKPLCHNIFDLLNFDITNLTFTYFLFQGRFYLYNNTHCVSNYS
jgi:hypothetical protein